MALPVKSLPCNNNINHTPHFLQMDHVYELVVLGAAESGVGAARLAKAKGLSVFVSDSGKISSAYADELKRAEIPFEEGGHTESIILSATEIVKSPGIPDKAPVVKAARAQSINVISEIEFACRYTKAKLVGITGSNGKTTTTLLTFHLLKQAGYNVGLAGNVGYSLAELVIDDAFDWYVIELSSFQLDGMVNARIDIAVLLNITPDHLDRYNYDFSQYAASKFRILQNQQAASTFIACVEANEALATGLAQRPIAGQLVGVGLTEQPSNATWIASDGSLVFRRNELVVKPDQQPLKGSHNKLNMMCAISAAQAAGLTNQQILDALPSFTNAPHRLQEVGTINGVTWVNDSKATNVDSVFYALQSFKVPLVLILGGVDKGNDYNQIADLVIKHCKALVFMGTDNTPLIKFFGSDPRFAHLPQASVNSLASAMEAAESLAQSGDVVLLSPACASFDLFKNYEDRGNQFMAWVKAKL